MRVTEYTWLNSWLIIRSGIRMFGFTQRRVVPRLPWAPNSRLVLLPRYFSLLFSFFFFFFHSFIRSFVRSFVCLFLFFPSFFCGETRLFSRMRAIRHFWSDGTSSVQLSRNLSLRIFRFRLLWNARGKKTGHERRIRRSTSKYSVDQVNI